MYRFAKSFDSPGLWCDHMGLSYNQLPLLERNERGKFKVCPLGIINSILNMDVSDRLPSFESCANALNRGDVVCAGIAALHLKLPMTFDVQTSLEMGFIRKANFNPGEARDEHGRWTSDGSAPNSPSPTRDQSEIHAKPNPLLQDIGFNDIYHNYLRDDLAAYFQKKGANVLKEVPFDTVAGDSTRADIFLQLPDGRLRIIEIKTGDNPTFTLNQAAAYPLIDYGNHASSPDQRVRKFGLTPNTPLPPIEVIVTYKRDVFSGFQTKTLAELYHGDEQ